MKNKPNPKRIRRRILALCLILVMALPTGCGQQKQEINSLDDLKNDAYIIGMGSDIGVEELVYEYCPDAEIVYVDGVDFIEPLKSGKMDVFLMGEMQLKPIVQEHRADGFVMLDESLCTFEVGLGLSKSCAIENFEELVNECIRSLKADGTIAEMKERWSTENPVKAEIPRPENPEYTLKVATYGLIKPFTYYENNVLTGFDVELAERVAARLGFGIEWEVVDFPSMLAGLAVGKYDMIASNLFKSGEREETFTYSETYNEERLMLVTVHEPDETGFDSLEDLDGAVTFSSVTGSIYPEIIREKFPNAEIIEYNSLMDSILAVQSGKADATIYDEPLMAHVAVENPDLKVLDEKLMTESYYFCTAKSEEGTALAEDFDRWLAEVKQSGLLEEMTDFWIGTEDPDGRIDFSSLTGENGTLVVGTDISARPDVFLYNNEPVGLPMELVYRYCLDRGLSVELQTMNFGAFPTALTTGKIDFFASFISYTDERAESLSFTEAFYDGGVAVLVRKTGDTGTASFWSSLQDSFEKTFLREQRWKMILSGLGVTLMITLGSFVLANLLGALFCGFNLSDSKALHIISNVYFRIMQGTPMVVVLMILYYVVLGKTKISGTIVAMLGFGLSIGADLAQSFEGAVRSVDKGQKEASLALGFTGAQTFRGIVFPQAVRSILPSYFAELIALLKGTSIVGYITVVDLTKASDIIRASTYEAFFPLLMIALMYFLLINLLLSLMKGIQKKLQPKRVTAKEETK